MKFSSPVEALGLLNVSLDLAVIDELEGNDRRYLLIWKTDVATR